MIVTIDGPAGSGKSTAARLLAEHLGFDFLDTGAMYRAVALALARRGIDLGNTSAVEAELSAIHIEMPSTHLSPGGEVGLKMRSIFKPGEGASILLNGEDVSTAIRSPETSQGASKVAVIPAVRLYLASEQRRIAAGRDIVCEGRDQGTFVFPHAECKFFLTADSQARAERRHRELIAKGESISLEDVLKSQQERDARDADRDLAPMKPAADAAILDTTHLAADEVIAQLISEVSRRCPTDRA